MPMVAEDLSGIRRGNIRRAMRAVARERGFKVDTIKYAKTLGVSSGMFFPATKQVFLGTHGTDAKPIMLLAAAAHELAHASGVREEGSQHQDVTRNLYHALKAKALEFAQKDRSRRKSDSVGGDIQVSGYTRNGHDVSAYTRSRPGR